MNDYYRGLQSVTFELKYITGELENDKHGQASLMGMSRQKWNETNLPQHII